MRLWSIHPCYLDSKGLLAVWRETLLAKKVLEGRTKGYKHHPQLYRFKECPSPLDEINLYLSEIYNESQIRGYNFNKDKISTFNNEKTIKIPVTEGQIEYEFKLLQTKLKKRDNIKNNINSSTKIIKVNKVFTLVKGSIENWEKIKDI